MADRVEVEGLARFRATLASAIRRLETPTGALEDSGRLLEARGRGAAPVRSGALAGSLRAAVSGPTVEVTSALPYAAVTEYGGGNNIPAQPFLRPALANSEPLIMQAFTKEANEALSTVKGI